jgi:DNA topoisomerase-2
MWTKFTHREHILARPDTYVGPIENVMNKIFQEIIVNASDEYLRDSKSNHIEVIVDDETHVISVTNNKCIPVVRHEEENLWLIELIFGHLLTSSNFDDSSERYTGGRNGYGAKLTNIFSTKFTVTSCDPVNNLEYSQTWEKNMSVCNEPKIKKYRYKTGKTTIMFEPDMSRIPIFDIDSLKEITIETGIWIPRVHFNGELVSGSFDSYAKRFVEETAKMSFANWEVIIGRSTDGFKQHSFVNGLRTSRGGTHVDHVVSEVCKHLGSTYRVSQVKPHLFVFVKLLVDKPVFSSQTKNELETVIKPGTLEIKPKFIKDLLATGLSIDLDSI